MSQILFGQKSPKTVKVSSTVHMCLLRAPARPPAPLLTPPSLRKVYIHKTHGGGGNVAVAAAVCERGSGSTPPRQTKRASALAAYSALVAGSGEPPQVQARPYFIPANTCTSQQFSLEQHSLSLAMYTYSYKYEMFWHNYRVIEFFPFS